MLKCHGTVFSCGRDECWWLKYWGWHELCCHYWLNHWLLGDLDATLKILFSSLLYWLVPSELLLIKSSDEWYRNLLMISQHWFRYWLGAVRQQAITWANVDPDLCRRMASLGHNKHVRLILSVFTCLKYHWWICIAERLVYCHLNSCSLYTYEICDDLRFLL